MWNSITQLIGLLLATCQPLKSLMEIDWDEGFNYFNAEHKRDMARVTGVPNIL